MRAVSALSLASLVLGACFVDAFGPPGPGGVSCTNAEDCPDDENPCTRVDCVERLCAYPAVPDGPTLSQEPGDCRTLRCAAGVFRDEVDDGDTDDGVACTKDECADGIASHTPIPEGGSCEIGGGQGTCINDVCRIECSPNEPCPDPHCQTSSCESGFCVFVDQEDGPPDPPLMDSVVGDCRKPWCVNGQVSQAPEDSDVGGDDGNDCTIEGCDDGNPVAPPAAADTPCGSSSVCDGEGICVECNTNNQCGPPAPCSTPVCVDGDCSVMDEPVGTSCGDGVCDGDGLCVECLDASDCTTLPCSVVSCALNVCEANDAPDGTTCDAGFANDGQCLAGSCVECVDDDDCTGMDVCCSNSCSALPCP
jgi:hypothetical protein